MGRSGTARGAEISATGLTPNNRPGAGAPLNTPQLARPGVLAVGGHPGIMTGMLTSRADKWTRIAIGLNLLLLLVAQQKLCPWLMTPPREAKPDPPDTHQNQSHDDRTDPEKPSNDLPFLLPDTEAPAPRWPASWNQARLRQTTGWHDGVVSCGELDPSESHSPTAEASLPDRWAWHRFLLPVEPCGLSPRPVGPTLTTDPAVRTSISRTGPPRA